MINTDKFIDAMGYGMALLSPSLFEDYRKKFNIRTKKMLSFFDKHNDVFYNFIDRGLFLPLNNIGAYPYKIFFSLGEIELPKGWEIIDKWEPFNLEIADNTLWAFSFEQMQNWNYNKLVNIEEIENNNYIIEDKSKIPYKGLKYVIPNGKYIVEVIGIRNFNYKRYYSFGFIFNLIFVNSFIKPIDSSQVDYSKLFEN